MKRNLLTVLALSVAVAGFALAQPEGGPHGWHHGEHGDGGPLEHMTKTLNLTPEQQAKVQPILDQAKPQMQAIHQEAMTKSKAVMDNAMAQIRPLLTPDQQKKADSMQQAHQDMEKAAKEMHDAAQTKP